MSLDKKNDDIEELSLDDVEVELKIDGDVELESESLSKPLASGVSNKTDKDDTVNNLPSGGLSMESDAQRDMESLPDEGVSNKTDKDDTVNNLPSGGLSMESDAQRDMESLPDEGVSTKTDKDDDINDLSTGGKEQSQEPKGLKDRIDNAKQKYQNQKDKFNKVKNNIKNAPDNLRKKRDALKDKWNNRPKSMKDLKDKVKNGAKNAGKNLKKKAKQGVKNAANKAKEDAIEGFKNSDLGQAIDKGKNAVNNIKKTVKIIKTLLTSKIFLIILACILIISVISVIPSLLASGSPGLGGEVENEENYSKYSEVDQKTIEKLKEITEKYPTGDPSYAMAATLYPYIEEMQNGNVASLRGKTNETQEDDEDIYDDEDKKSNEEDTDDLEDNENDTIADDPYLELFQKRKYRNKFRKLLKESKDGEDALTSYLKNTWFKKDAGYKELFNDASNDDELADAIIDDLLSQKDDFLGYFYENCNTTNASTTLLNAAGNVNNFSGSIYVTLRDYFADSDGYFRADSYYNSPALYQTDSDPLTFARYVMGVVYAESESCLDSESCAKSLMITAKSFAIGRQSSQGYKPEVLEDRTIIHMRGNVGDQDFCDVYEGCKEGRFSKDTWSVFTGEGYKNRKGPLASDKLSNLEKWWNDIADQYVIRKEDNKFAGNQYNDYNDSCKKGKCVSQTRMLKASKSNTDYMNLLFNADNGGFDNTLYTLYSSSSNELYAVTTGDKVCNNENLTGSRQSIVNFAVSMIGKIPYYFYEGQSDGYGALGHALSKTFEDNHFAEKSATYTDYSGRDKYGLDCSGFVDFVFWNALDNNLGNGNTDTLRNVSTKIEYKDLKPGDLGFLNDGSSGTEQHVGIYIGNDEWIELNPSGVTKGPYPDFKVYYRPNILFDLDAKEGAQGDGVSTGSMSSPIKDKTLSCNDYPNYSSGAYHGGTDLSVSIGTEVLAVDGGEVITSKDLKGCNGKRCVGGYYSYGRYIVIQHDNGLTSLYAHLSERLVNEGDKVSKGQLIGLSGENGNTTGPHLHLEIKLNRHNQNPCNYVK